jgi:hypothetical protein
MKSTKNLVDRFKAKSANFKTIFMTVVCVIAVLSLIETAVLGGAALMKSLVVVGSNYSYINKYRFIGE